MDFRVIHIAETASTNDEVRRFDEGENLCLWADYQVAGRGCGSNKWESAAGENLLFSLLVHPVSVSAAEQFSISMAISVAIVDALSAYTDDLSIKWPNDIYWKDRKLAGILIENQLSGARIRRAIIGVGLDVNQAQFVSDAPNPVSLYQITGRKIDREDVLRRILANFDETVDAARYREKLYRKDGYFAYQDAQGAFEARMKGVEDDGHLLLVDKEGRERRYAFKEVKYII